MDIRIGQLTSPENNTPAKTIPGDWIEARLLHHRRPRLSRGSSLRQTMERRRSAQNQCDPYLAKVLLLMVPEGHRLPADFANGNYRVFLHVVPR